MKKSEITEAPLFTKEQLLQSKTIGISADVLQVALEDGKTYTKEQAVQIAEKLLKRKV